VIISPILLAAGHSKRFGSDKLCHSISVNNKLAPIIIHTLAVWLSVFDSVTLVTRSDNQRLVKLLTSTYDNKQINLVFVDELNAEMSVSLRNGIQAKSSSDAWLIGLADMPYLHASVLRDSVTALTAHAEITRAFYHDEPGHPVGFTSKFYYSLMNIEGDSGAKSILQSHHELITRIPSPDNGIFRDIDTKSDLKTVV
jgi:molybdenum cofactor cytidylyltransferase